MPSASISAQIVIIAGGLAMWWILGTRRKKQVTVHGVADEQPVNESMKQIVHESVKLPSPVQIQSIHPNEESVFLDGVELKRVLSRGTITVVYGSVSGTCRKLALKLAKVLKMNTNLVSTIQVASAKEFDWWDELLNDDGPDANSSPPALLILLLSTYTNGSWPPDSSNLLSSLNELRSDWRISKSPLRKKLNFAVFGTGSSEYDEDGSSSMGQPARDSVLLLRELGAKCLVDIQIGDDAIGDHLTRAYERWESSVINCQVMQKSYKCCGGTMSHSNGKCCGSDRTASNAAFAIELEPLETGDGGDSEGDDDEDVDSREPEVMDVEDLGDTVFESSQITSDNEPREMLTPSQAKSLQKEGYKIIGSHSAVKLCRWTKHQLRGRGGCYKHTFYGITSYQCMETTPSLACANKCVFCWRHHKNPVGKEWRWKTDDPHYIVDQAIQKHVQMIKEARGIPGVQMDRWRAAHTVRHCALSLVGEPIMYPRIDELLFNLHCRKISTFLVTNGQHPSAISSLRPVTQLYVSVDAPSQESLIAIDRPLFSDAWERLRKSLSSLKLKGQRTVARLTVVKGWNSDELEGYARLIALGHVSLVEIKGVTFCGKSDASNLNMTNTPWHHEVVDLAKSLKDEIDKLRSEVGDETMPEYGIACEHKHSCSVLLARVDQFAVNDRITGNRRWNTWIDYEKFHELAARHVMDPTFSFKVEDYTAETPSWALFGSSEEGFDPTDMRHRKKSKHPKYTKFDSKGIPTHDHDDRSLPESERQHLRELMEERKRQMGATSVVTESSYGAKEILDASLMFRGLVVVK